MLEPDDALAHQARILAAHVEGRADSPVPAFAAPRITGLEELLIGYLAALLADGLVRLLRGLFSRWFARGRVASLAADYAFRGNLVGARDSVALADRLAAETGPWARGLSRAEYRELVGACLARGWAVDPSEDGEG